MLRVEQEAAAATQRAEERARASSSGRWGSEELEAFTGLRWVKQDTGVHRFTHAATGFSFQLSAADPEQFDDDDDAERRKRRESDVMGGAGAPADDRLVRGHRVRAADGFLPGYLSEAIEFERCEMPEFVGRMLGVPQPGGGGARGAAVDERDRSETTRQIASKSRSKRSAPPRSADLRLPE